MALGNLQDRRDKIHLDKFVKTFVRNAYVSKVLYQTLDTPNTNIYHDEIEKTYKNPLSSWCYIEFNAPTKVVKELGWWKEEDNVPTIMYMPKLPNIVPKKGDRITFPADSIYFNRSFRVNHTNVEGQRSPIVWVLNISPDRVDV